VKILREESLKKLNNRKITIILPDEDISRDIITKYLKEASTMFDTIFLRWDRHNSSINKAVNIDQKVSLKIFDREMIKNTIQISKKSSDWWRQVGAVLVKKGEVLLVGYNRHVPSPHSPYANGDPRNNFHKGINLELSTAIHAEASVIADAAKKGLKLEGTSIYVSTFPCPPCAKLIAYSGIKKLYYSGGYGVLDGEDILKSQGVKIIYVDMGTS
jgi:dCMP deaminase